MLKSILNETTKQVLFVFQSQSITEQQIIANFYQDWLSLSRIIAEPKEMYCHDTESEAFDIEKISAYIKGQLSVPSQSFFLSLKESEADFFMSETVVDSGRSIYMKILLSLEKFTIYQNLFVDFVQTQMKNQGLYAFLRDYDEYLYHNILIPAQRTFEPPDETAKLPKVYNSLSDICVDGQRLAGFDVHYQSLRFTACWQMWYSSVYYQCIPQAVFEDLQQVEQVEVFPDYLQIILFKHVERWQHPANQDLPMFVRDQLGFDQLIWENGIGVLREPHIEYVSDIDKLYTIQYQDERFRSVAKRKSSHFVSRFYEKDSQKYKEEHYFGQLNSRAFFPYQDEKNKRMGNYQILDPENTVDKGVEAYSFYIKQHFDIKVAEEKMQAYRIDYAFYIPDELLSSVPIQGIMANFADAQISEPNKQAHEISFSMKQKERHLTIYFRGLSQLEKFKEQVSEKSSLLKRMRSKKYD